jgi:hypothetical protein
MSIDAPHVVFTNAEVATFWRFISSSLDRLMLVLDGRTLDELNWRPPAPATNSIYALAVHTLANARENILGTLCAQLPEQNSTRDHAAEFASIANETNVPIPTWPGTRHDIEVSLAALGPDALSATYTHPRRGEITGLAILIVVARHTAEHLGQAELTRDMAIDRYPET